MRAFLDKAQILLELVVLERAVSVVFCRAGFTAGALEVMREQGVAWSDDPAWMEPE